MTDSLTCESLSRVMALIAERVLDDDAIPERLGDITLRTHQRRAADRLCGLIAANGGALLADRVGLGKTFTALAVAFALHEHPMIVAPAALRDMWHEAGGRAGVAIAFTSHEALSRGADAPASAFVIVDEAHRVRSVHTRRYAAVAALCARARVLLLTATPVQNHRADLAAELALFLGRGAWSASEEELARHVVRGGSDVPRMPRLDGPHPIALTTPEACVDQLLSLPPPVSARDESVAAALLTYGLLHQWTSSRAALVAALTRRRARGVALASALEAGRRPSHAELSAWAHGGNSLQLAFPELVVDAVNDRDFDAAAFRAALDRHMAAVAHLLRLLAGQSDPDHERAEILRRIRARHPGERVIAFCQYAETVNALRTALRRDSGVATLTAAGGRIASGRISRQAVIAQYTPSPDGVAGARPIERIDLLITTDLLSEGLNLQEASVVVHLDLPWNPARLEQRVGRVRRLGSRHDVVTVYTIAPPVSAERLLRLEARLRAKLEIARRTVGVAGRILPTTSSELLAQPGAAECGADVRERLRQWRRTTVANGSPADDETLIAAAGQRTTGFLALVEDCGTPRLVSDLDAGISAAPQDLARTLTSLERQALAGHAVRRDVHDADVVAALKRLDAWLVNQAGAATIDLAAAGAARSRRKALARVAQALARAPRHQRAAFAPLAAAARAVGTAPLGEGAERILETLVAAPLDDEAWLRSLAAFSELNARPVERTSGRSRIVAVVFV